jgi:hypothetical protein
MSDQDPWAFEKPLGSEPDRTVDAKLAAVVPLPAASMEWYRAIRRMTSGGRDIATAVKIANQMYPIHTC